MKGESMVHFFLENMGFVVMTVVAVALALVASYQYKKLKAVTTIVITERTDDIHAQLEGSKAWGCGKATSTAIGDLVHAHPELFKVRVVFPGDFYLVDLPKSQS